ncbi:MAG: indolepyruvate ferredoxin oxidoreductase subunit alpha, partial [Proteobacteria bacterium]|nr:indolepyruvate ferredoxin oxidoreductase subunit alpha [Pseudomonadota bacterium]
KRKTKGDFKKDPFNYVTVPAVARKLHAKLLENFKHAETISETSAYNFITGKGSLGIICNGVSYNYVYDAVIDLDIGDRVKILRIGFSHPMPANLIKDFLKECKKALIVEEGEPYMEERVKALAQEEGLTLLIRGKGKDLFSRLYEFNPGLVRQCIAKYFDVPYTLPETVDLSDIPADIPEIPQRPPNLCAGCSHRATYYAVKKAAEGTETIYPTDIGCYT